MDDKIKLRAVSAPWHAGVELLAVKGEMVAAPATFVTTEDGFVTAPTFTVGMSEGQTLMDDLWAIGFRPTEGTGSAGSLRATEKHLQDMRKIAFKKLGLEDK